MAERLKNILTFNNLAQGASVALPHGLHTAVGRALAPDIIFVPSEFLEVASDAVNVTLTNLGPSVLSGDLFVESWHTIERGFNNANSENLPVKPYIVVSPEGGNQPAQPVYSDVDVFIFARTTGSDATGDGTLANPYRTLQRAIRDVPTNVPAGTTYRVDITGLGTETLPQQYKFPVFLGAEGIGDFDFSQRFFHYYTTVNVQADPQLATGVDGITTIPAAGAVVTTPTVSTGLLAIQSPGAGWTAGQLKGKFAVGAGTATEHSVIWDNTADTVFLTKSGATPTFPIQIMECSAHLQAAKDSADLHEAGINALNTNIGFLGIKLGPVLNNDGGPFGGWAFQMGGNTPPTSLQLCDITGVGLVATSWVRTRQCYLKESLFLNAPWLFKQCYLDGSLEVQPAGPRVTVWGARGLDSLINQTVIEATTAIRPRDLFDNHLSGPVGLVELQQVQILDTIGDFPIANDDAINFTGSTIRLIGVDISRSAPGAGNALYIAGPAIAYLTGVTGADYDLGVRAEDGAQVVVDDGGGTVTAIAGTSGAFKPGSLAIEAAWPVPVYPAAGSNFPDYDVSVGSAAMGVRVVKKS